MKNAAFTPHLKYKLAWISLIKKEGLHAARWWLFCLEKYQDYPPALQISPQEFLQIGYQEINNYFLHLWEIPALPQMIPRDDLGDKKN